MAPRGFLCDLTLTLPSGDQRRLAIDSSRIIRIGRKRDCEVLLDFEGVSLVHAELLVTGTDGEDPDDCRLCVRDSSRNGSAVKPDSEAWEKLEKGVLRALGQGYLMKVPVRSRQGAKQLSEGERTLTVTNLLFKEKPEPPPVSPPRKYRTQEVQDYSPMARGAADAPFTLRAEALRAAVPELARRVAAAAAAPAAPMMQAVAAAAPAAPAQSLQEAAASVLLNAAVQRRRPKESRRAAAAAAIPGNSAFWQESAQPAAPVAALPGVPQERGRSRSRGDGMAFVPRDMSVSPISEPGVGPAGPIRARKKKRPKASAQGNPADGGKPEKIRAPKEGKEKRKARKGLREATGEERPAKKKKSRRAAAAVAEEDAEEE